MDAQNRQRVVRNDVRERLGRGSDGCEHHVGLLRRTSQSRATLFASRVAGERRV